MQNQKYKAKSKYERKKIISSPTKQPKIKWRNKIKTKSKKVKLNAKYQMKTTNKMNKKE